MPDWPSVYEQLKDSGVDPAGATAPMPVSGGDISAAWRLATVNGELFIKTGPLSVADMFAAEAEGLGEIARTNTVSVPEVISLGHTESTAFLALEWIPLEPANAKTEHCLGEQLAEMHQVTRDRYGWHRDNTIGLTEQRNTWSEDWVDFFREHRLGFQLHLAAQNGFTGELQDSGSRLLKRLPVYFEGAEPVASLLHGDLWGGNWGCSRGHPVLFDPAVYFGDRETDIAMTRLFGGFASAFFEAYESSWPLPDGYRERQDLYQLYHVLNHLNLFGSGYLGRAIGLMDRLL